MIFQFTKLANTICLMFNMKDRLRIFYPERSQLFNFIDKFFIYFRNMKMFIYFKHLLIIFRFQLFFNQIVKAFVKLVYILYRQTHPRSLRMSTKVIEQLIYFHSIFKD